MAQLTINYTATADIKNYSYQGSTWTVNNIDQNASTWDSTTNEGTLVLNDGIAWFASGTFRNCTDLLTITLPVGFLYLYGPNISSDVNGVFAGCTNLTTVNILDTNIQISNATFYDCPSLTTINFSDLNQKNVSDYTFCGCNSLLQSNFNWANITSIGRYAFYGCRSFTNLELKTTNASSFAYCTGLTSVKITGLLIASNCFQGCTSLSSVAISNTTNQIDSYAFSGCTSLTSIDLQNIKRLDSNVFSGCTNLSTIKTLRKIPPQNTTSSTFPANNLTLYVPFTGLSNYQGSTFASYFTQIIPFNVIEYTATTDLKDFSSWCTINVDQTSSLWNSSTNKGTLVLNPNVTSISTGAFANCTTLTSILLYNLDIDTSAFTGCTSLIAVQCIDSSPRTLGTGNFTGATPNLYVISDYMSAFQNDSSWSSAFNTINAFFKITFTASNTINTVLYDYTVYYEYDSVSHEGAFHLCYDFTTLPQSAFYGVTSLTSITIPNDITSISIGCFQMCSNLVHVNLPEELTFISEQAFSQCSNLTSITIPENVTTIQQGAFMNCSKLTTVNWNAIHARPGSSMYYRVFANCSALTNFNIGNSVEYIPQGLFNSSNTSFTNLVIPSSVTSIDSYAFNNLTNLLSVTSLATTPPTLGGNNFSASGDTLYTPMASKSAYQSANNWSTAFTNYVGLCEVTSTVTGSGSVSPSSSTVPEGESATLTITPAEGNGIFSVTDNDTSVPVTPSGMTYTISNIAADHAIAVVFKPLFTITTSASEGGTITPTTEVLEGESFTVTATPNAHYKVSHFVVDGVDVGTVDNYTFQNLDANHTIHVDFELITHTITATAGTGGSIIPSGSVTVNDGSDQTFTITPNAGYSISHVYVDGVDQGSILNYSFQNVVANHTVTAEFVALYTVSTTTTEGGSVSPESSTVVAGSDVTLTITPDEGMLIFNVLDNDTSVPVLNPLGMTYTISNIQENHTVEAIFMVAQTWGFNLEEMIDTDFMIQTLEELEERK